MRKAEYKQIDTKLEPREIVTYDEEGNEIITTESVEVPVMGMVYRDMTAEEIAEMNAIEPPIIDPTESERLEAIESALLDIIMGGGSID